MADSHQTQSHGAPATQAGHEDDDIRIKPLIFGLAGLIALIAFAFVATREIWVDFLAQERKTASAVRGRFADDTGQFPAPQNQPDPAGELRQLRDHETGHLNKYGWVDSKAKIAHIPIDRAIDLVTERGLPARQQQPTEVKRP
jgi:hypothetical protein